LPSFHRARSRNIPEGQTRKAFLSLFWCPTSRCAHLVEPGRFRRGGETPSSPNGALAPLISTRRVQAGSPWGQARVWAQFRQGGWEVFLFYSCQAREERKVTPPAWVHAWVRLATKMGARMPQICLTPAHLAEPGTAWLPTAPGPRTTLRLGTKHLSALPACGDAQVSSDMFDHRPFGNYLSP
jgi:hypothetical protein